MKSRVLVLLWVFGVVMGALTWVMGVTAVAQPTLSPAAPHADPDLVVELSLLDEAVVPVGQPLSFRVVVSNVGAANVTNTVPIGLFVNPYAVLTDAVDGVMVGQVTAVSPTMGVPQTFTLTTRLMLGVGEHQFYAWADPGHLVTESVENNNIAGPVMLTVSHEPSLARLDPGGIYANRRDDGVLNTQNLITFGPDSCTNLGDAFSPQHSPWASGLYTYTYRIRIPADYPHDVVRVELFDPDSMNQPGSIFEIQHTQLAVDQGEPLFETLSCTSSSVNQYQPCLINTGEANLGLPFDDINPFWFVRLDENRRPEASPNTGCGAPLGNIYTPAYNTQTTFRLYYLTKNSQQEFERVDVAAYTGQVGDGVRDDGSHLTDMQWVSPGAPDSVGQPASVPTACGSANGGDYDPVTCPGGTPPGAGSGFEVDLTQDVPGMVTDPESGDRFLYLDITTVSGASENGFAIWAGPNTYTNAVPSDVNLRNVYVLDNWDSHSSAGVTVYALDYLPLNSNVNIRMDIPLMDLGPEYAGQIIEVALFDSDSGSSPPAHFYVDTLAFNDWHLTTGYPNDGTGRCGIGSCNNLWTTPPYTITLPSINHCDWLNPDPQTCTPFYGGRLMVSYDGGVHDTYTWHVAVPDAPQIDPTQSCAAMPTAVSLYARSVTPPGTGSNPYPTPSGLTYPRPLPEYTDFPFHHPDAPLVDAQPGDLFLFHRGIEPGEFNWLRWNAGISPTASTLANSLTWPGDTLDYADHADVGQPAAPLYPYVVRGYVNPDNSSDLQLQVGDMVPIKTGFVNVFEVFDALRTHVDQSRNVLMPVWNEVDLPSEQYRMERFGIFRLVGFELTQSIQAWLLLEFVQWDDSCGQAPAPEVVTIAGPEQGVVLQHYTFTAVITPSYATLPITYTWQASGISETITHTGGISDTAVFSWPVVGQQVVTVTAVNDQGIVSDTHAITILPPLPDLQVSAPALLGTGPLFTGRPVAFTATVTNPATTDVSEAFFVDLFLDPTEVLSDSIPIVQSAGYVTLAGLAAGESRVVTITAATGFNSGPNPHHVYVMVDSAQNVDEAEELNNVSPPLLLDVVEPVPISALAVTGPEVVLVGELYTVTAVVGPPSATLPITYTWQPTGQDPITTTGDLSSTLTFVWQGWGEVELVVTVDNAALQPVTAVFPITVRPRQLYLPFIYKPQ